jgi:hypothetical protein
MDPGVESDRGVGASERAYRALMRAYPEEVRRRYEEEMVGYFGDLCREERLSKGPRGVVLLWARTLPELVLTALEERATLFRRNAYLPAAPGSVARWGALCALVGGILGVAFHLIEYSLLGALGILTGNHSYGNGPLAMFFTLSLLLGALSLSSLGPFGLYGAVVARSGRPGLLAGAGAILAAVSAALLLATSGYAAVHQVASGWALFRPFEWLWYAGSAVLPVAFAAWFLALLTLGGAAALERRLPVLLRIAPLAVLALAALGYEFGGWFEMVGGSPVANAVVMGFGQGLPFAGVALLGWVLLKDNDTEQLAGAGNPVESAGAAGGMARSANRRARGAPGVRSGTSGEKAAREKELLEALRRRGALTVAGAALETSLSVEEADRMLSELTAKGHLEVRVERGRLLYSLWESQG